MASSITTRAQLTCTDSLGDIVQGMAATSATQVLAGAFSNVQSIAVATSVAVSTGTIATPMYLLVTNLGTGSTDTTSVVYLDGVGAATAASPVKLLPGQSCSIPTASNTWHAIFPGYTATSLSLQVVAVAM